MWKLKDGKHLWNYKGCSKKNTEKIEIADILELRKIVEKTWFDHVRMKTLDKNASEQFKWWVKKKETMAWFLFHESRICFLLKITKCSNYTVPIVPFHFLCSFQHFSPCHQIASLLVSRYLSITPTRINVESTCP